MLLPGRGTLIVGAAALLAVVVLAGIAHYWKSRAEGLMSELTSARMQLELAVSANESNQAAIAEQRLAIETWKNRAFTMRQALDHAIQTVELFEDELKEQTARRARAEAKDREIPECKALLEINLAGVCPAHGSGLRERAEGNNQNGN